MDDEDYERVSAFRWHLHGKERKLYVSSNEVGYLHRFILGLRVGDLHQVDHVSGDPLDNQRRNLRIASPSQNGQNRNTVRGSSSYRGVAWDRTKEKWVAYAKIEGKQFFLGRFDDEDAAGTAAATFRRERMPFSSEAMAAVRGSG